MSIDMAGFTRLEVGASSKFRSMWFRLDNPDTDTGTLRVEFHNRKNPDGHGALYDYKVTQELVFNMIENSQVIGGESFGSLFHKEVVSKPDQVPYTLVAPAQ